MSNRTKFLRITYLASERNSLNFHSWSDDASASAAASHNGGCCVSTSFTTCGGHPGYPGVGRNSTNTGHSAKGWLGAGHQVGAAHEGSGGSNFVRNVPVHLWWTAGSGLPVSSGLDLQHRGSQHWASWMACMAKVNSGLFDCMVYSHDKNKRPQIDVLVIPGMLLSKLLMAATSRRAFTLLEVADILGTIGTSWDQDQFNYLALADTSLPFPFEETLRTDWMAEQAKGTPYCTSGKESSLIW